MSADRTGAYPTARDIHEPGEYVPGLGWSCLTCDTFGCVGVDHKFLPDLAGRLVHQDCWCER